MTSIVSVITVSLVLGSFIPLKAFATNSGTFTMANDSGMTFGTAPLQVVTINFGSSPTGRIRRQVRPMEFSVQTLNSGAQCVGNTWQLASSSCGVLRCPASSLGISDPSGQSSQTAAISVPEAKPGTAYTLSCNSYLTPNSGFTVNGTFTPQCGNDGAWRVVSSSCGTTRMCIPFPAAQGQGSSDAVAVSGFKRDLLAYCPETIPAYFK